ncbi:uncharacterized protein LOC134242337 [Saccostrea cucullata]|uniref:uncharacterized protein LOC134242337 n=1 Tax=Saccostrea cuccullata TaxID=36930 RepID=UPI002ED3E40E
MNRLRLHLFDCLFDIRHGDVMTDSKDDVMVTRRRVWRMKKGGNYKIWGAVYKALRKSNCKSMEGENMYCRRDILYYSIIKSDCKGLKHIVCLGLDVNQWIQLYDDNERSDWRALLFTLIDEMYHYGRLIDNVMVLLEAGVDVNVRVRYSEYDSLLDREGVSVLERTRRLVSEVRKSWFVFEREEVTNYRRVLNEVKKHLRRYSV